jgi:uncharacterized protein (TIGR02246 family)
MDEQQIRDLIERWARAVHTGDLDGVLADHADDIVMFDVPPPQEGVRGIDAYRETWPPFFAWQAGGATFDILSLDVVAGADVAFAYALLKCGTKDEPEDQRLRVTIGLRKTGGRWQVTHEHHSFPLRTTGESEQEVRAIHERWFDRTRAKDLDGLMGHIADDVVSYEHQPPLQYVGVDAVRDVCRAGLEASDGEISWAVPDLRIVADGDLAVAWGLNEFHDGSRSRGTRVFRRGREGWAMVHQHLSVPSD